MHYEVTFRGHPNIRSLHKKTIEITKDSDLTPAGDCIIGVNASCGCKDLPDKLKAKLRDPESIITITIKANDEIFRILGRGNDRLSLEHPHDIVIRKSTFVCPRTLAIKCDKASDSIPRTMIEYLRDPRSKGVLAIDIE